MQFGYVHNGYIGKCDNPNSWKDKRQGKCKGLITVDDNVWEDERGKLLFCSTYCRGKSNKLRERY